MFRAVFCQNGDRMEGEGASQASPTGKSWTRREQAPALQGVCTKFVRVPFFLRFPLSARRESSPEGELSRLGQAAVQPP